VFYSFPDEGLVKFRLEYCIRKLQLSNYLIGKVFYLNLRHTTLAIYDERCAISEAIAIVNSYAFLITTYPPLRPVLRRVKQDCPDPAREPY
jgi:hypothetical protein